MTNRNIDFLFGLTLNCGISQRTYNIIQEQTNKRGRARTQKYSAIWDLIQYPNVKKSDLNDKN